MREIKFRAWDKIEGKMWNPIIGRNGNLLAPNQIGGYVNFGNKDPLMQYTGLKDNLNKEIYEGDVVSWGDDLFEVVIFEDGHFCTERSMLCSETMQVIGNIYENPELLEANK